MSPENRGQVDERAQILHACDGAKAPSSLLSMNALLKGYDGAWQRVHANPLLAIQFACER